MALTTPLLIMMVLGLTEVGFLANNYLILMDAVRAGGRVAVNLDPTNWAYGQARNQQRLDRDTDPDWYTMMIGTVNTNEYGARNSVDLPKPPSAPTNFAEQPRASNPSTFTTLISGGGYGYTTDTTVDPPFGFFDEVACQTIYAMSPLHLNDNEDAATNKDDVVVSAVSYTLMEYTNNGATTGPALAANQTANKVTVTGRWPLENRFCGTATAGGVFQTGDSRDPFDYLTSDYGFTTGAVEPLYNPFSTLPMPPAAPPNKQKLTEGIEIAADGSSTPGVYHVLSPMTPTDNQHIRGFVFSGKNKNLSTGGADSDDCYGSRFRVQDIESRLNLDPTFNKSVPNGGLVIVEIFWQHHPLFFGPLFQGFSNDHTKDPVLHIWGFFPVPSGINCNTLVMCERWKLLKKVGI